MPKASPTRSISATTWCATNCSPRSATASRAITARRFRRAPSGERLRDHAAVRGARLRQLSAEPSPHQCRVVGDGGHLRRVDRAALAAAGLDAQSIDLIVLATSTPDNTFPATAVSVQAGLGISHGAAFDLQAVCSGFVFGLATVD